MWNLLNSLKRAFLFGKRERVEITERPGRVQKIKEQRIERGKVEK